MRTSYKKNRPFDFKLIDLVEPNTVLYRRQAGLSNYDVMKAKTEIWSKIAEVMDCDVDFCLMRWNNLHYQYRKMLRRAGTSTWPYFERLRFLSQTQQRAKPKPAPVQVEELKAQLETQTDELPNEEQNAWQSYNDCVVLQVGEVEQHADSTFIIEEIIESNEHMLQEEIIYEEAEQLQEELLATPVSNYLKMDKLLQQLQGNPKRFAERRIMAYVLKCQLRALSDEPIDDLVI
ncbi:hypothetical protein KR222_010256 [Zaprionus bogoriensis]|nr:hypothetical protein KR222_010256 [Zaprionus bogoriensis]